MAAAQNLQTEGNLPDISTSSFSNIVGQFVCGRSGALLSIDEDQAETLTENDRKPMNPNLPSQNSGTTQTPTSTTINNQTSQTSTTENPVYERFKDRKCVRETSEL